MDNLNIPICRAKKIDSDEYVEGYYVARDGTDVRDKSNYKAIVSHRIIDPSRYMVRLDLGNNEIIEDNRVVMEHEIDPSTLAISFNGGENWYSIEAVRWLIRLAEQTPSSKAHEILTRIQE